MSAEGKIALEILEPALGFVQRCPVDSRVIDGTFSTLGCPICGAVFCTFPCVDKLASRNRKCPVCKRFEMRGLDGMLKNLIYRTKLEELKSTRRVSDQVYQKLRREYEAKHEEIVARVYGQGGTAPLCSFCKKRTSYIQHYNRWYCYNCRKYLGSDQQETRVA